MKVWLDIDKRSGVDLRPRVGRSAPRRIVSLGPKGAGAFSFTQNNRVLPVRERAFYRSPDVWIRPAPRISPASHRTLAVRHPILMAPVAGT